MIKVKRTTLRKITLAWKFLSYKYFCSCPVLLSRRLQIESTAFLAKMEYVWFPVNWLKVPNSRINEVAEATVVSLRLDVWTSSPSNRIRGNGIPVLVEKQGIIRSARSTAFRRVGKITLEKNVKNQNLKISKFWNVSENPFLFWIFWKFMGSIFVH